MDYDLIVVGGGIGGCALAAVMAQAGAKILLLEASEVYEDRVRGEWIAPWGVTEVKRLGLYDLLVAAGVDYKAYMKLVGERPTVQKVNADRKAALAKA